jgi:hypothetical protein
MTKKPGIYYGWKMLVTISLTETVGLVERRFV